MYPWAKFRIAILLVATYQWSSLPKDSVTVPGADLDFIMVVLRQWELIFKNLIIIIIYYFVLITWSFDLVFFFFKWDNIGEKYHASSSNLKDEKKKNKGTEHMSALV